MNKGIIIVLSSIIVAAGCGGYIINQSKPTVPEDKTLSEVPEVAVPVTKDRRITGREIDFILQEIDSRDKNIIDAFAGIKQKIKSNNHRYISREQSITLISNILVEEMEGGFHTKAYDDGAGVLTIGFGSTFIRDKNGKERRVLASDKISKSEAIKLRVKAIKDNYSFLTKNIPSSILDKMSVYSVAALNSYIYNIGQAAFLRSEVFALLKENLKIDPMLLKTFKGSYITAAGKPMNGLVKRRKVESKLLGLSSKVKKTELVRFLAMDNILAGSVR
jgi:lysozyme